MSLEIILKLLIIQKSKLLPSSLFNIVIFQVTKVRPNDQDAKMKYNECNKIVKKIAFEKAISVDKKEVNIADTINLDAMSKCAN